MKILWSNTRFDANSVCAPSCLIRTKLKIVVIGALWVTSFKIYRLLLSCCIMQMTLFNQRRDRVTRLFK